MHFLDGHAHSFFPKLHQMMRWDLLFKHVQEFIWMWITDAILREG